VAYGGVLWCLRMVPYRMAGRTTALASSLSTASILSEAAPSPRPCLAAASSISLSSQLLPIFLIS
jgi:hypothetical protein